MKAKLDTSFKFTDAWSAENKAAMFIQLLLSVPCPHDPNDTYIQAYSYSFFVSEEFADAWINETKKVDITNNKCNWKQKGEYISLVEEVDLKWHDPLAWFWEIVGNYLENRIDEKETEN